MAIEGLHNVQVLRGLQTNKSLLSCTADGSEINLWNIDDGMGRQRWEFTLVNGETDVYNIKIVEGVTSTLKYLSCTADGSQVNLWDQDDGTGRQRWKVIPVEASPTCSTYLIKVAAGVSTFKRYLSCTADGSQVNLWDYDDGSGRQRWQLQGTWQA